MPVAGRARLAVGDIIELSVPIEELMPAAATLGFFVTVHDAAGIEVERHPAHRPIEVAPPDARFEALNWSA